MRWVIVLLCAAAAGCGGSTEPDEGAFEDARRADAEFGTGIEPTSGGEGTGGKDDGESDSGPVEVREGLASYYSDSLAGNKTANGDTYDPQKLTAASRDLPFGTVVRVTRKDTDGTSVTVRINDRGPFGNRRRILDLSRAAAEKLGMIDAGVVPIRAEILEIPEDEQD